MTTDREPPDPAAQPDVEPTQVRRIAGAVVAVVMVPFLALGLLDPLEGGMALLVALGLGLAAWALSLVPVPRFAWVPALAAVVLGVAALVVAAATNREEASGQQDISVPTAVLAVGYELAALATLVGGVRYAVRVVRAARRHPTGPSGTAEPA